MRLYHFLPAKWALDDLKRRRLKIAEIDKLNDPFELYCANQRDMNARIALRQWKRNTASRSGLLCFCANWKNPLLWSHYADRHTGMCLGFDVHNDCAGEVEYVSSRPPFSPPFTKRDTKRFLFTKFSGWSYEEEWRVWLRLQNRDPETKHYFRDIGEQLTLCEVIAGPLCHIPKSDILPLVKPYPNARILKARLAFWRFTVVLNRRGFAR